MIFKAWYHLTARYPRKLPETKQEYARLKEILVSYFGIRDEAATWTAIAGQITSTPAHEMRKSYRTLVNVARRLQVNNIAKLAREMALSELNDKLEESTKKQQLYLEKLALVLDENPELEATALLGDKPSMQALIDLFNTEVQINASGEEFARYIMTTLVERNIEAQRKAAHEQDSQKQPQTDAGPQPQTA